MKYNIGDFVETSYGNVLIVGKNRRYIACTKPTNGWNGWPINLTDCVKYSIDKKHVGRKAVYINDYHISKKIEVFKCWRCSQSFIHLNMKYSYESYHFICWDCRIKFL